MQRTGPSGCVQSDTVSFGFSNPQLTLPNDSTMCAGTTYSITAPAGFASYAWSNGSTTASTSFNSSGSYSLG